MVEKAGTGPTAPIEGMWEKPQCTSTRIKARPQPGAPKKRRPTPHTWGYGSATVDKCTECGLIVDRKKGELRPNNGCPGAPVPVKPALPDPCDNYSANQAYVRELAVYYTRELGLDDWDLAEKVMDALDSMYHDGFRDREHVV